MARFARYLLTMNMAAITAPTKIKTPITIPAIHPLDMEELSLVAPTTGMLEASPAEDELSDAEPLTDVDDAVPDA